MKITVTFVFLCIAFTSICFGQFSFLSDSTDARIQSGAMEEIDKKFFLQKDNDFEFRLFISPKWSDSKEGLSIFILTSKNGEWNTRLFKNAWLPKESQEISIRTDGIDSLWKKLNENDILTIPLAQDLVDSKGQIIIDQLQGDNNTVSYSFELLTKTAVRHYAYKCPLEFSKKYDYIVTFKKVSQIIQLILQFCSLETKWSC